MRYMGPTISRFVVERLLGSLGPLHVEAAAILERCHLEPRDVERLPERVPFALMRDLMVAVGEVSGEPSIGLRLAEMSRAEFYEVFGYVLRASATLGDAILRTGRYLRLITDAGQLNLQVEGDRGMILYRDARPELSHPQLVEFMLAVVAVIARQMSGKHLLPVEVRFTHAAAADPSHHAKFFGAPVLFLRPHNALVFSVELLHLPIQSRDSRLCALLERQAEQLLASLPRNGEYSTRVREALAAELRGGNPNADHIAECLGLHPRTLGRRLREEGTSHQALLDELRRDLAERHLTTSDASVGEIACLLGFADTSAFNKAFKRWNGTGPAAYRRRARLSPEVDGVPSRSNTG